MNYLKFFVKKRRLLSWKFISNNRYLKRETFCNVKRLITIRYNHKTTPPPHRYVAS